MPLETKEIDLIKSSWTLRKLKKGEQLNLSDEEIGGLLQSIVSAKMYAQK